MVFIENFQNAAPVSSTFVQTLADYPNGSATPTVPGYVGASGVRYTADPQWNGEFCNGLVVSQSAPSAKPVLPQTEACSDNGWTEVRNLAGTLGKWQADPDYPYAGLVPATGFMANLAVSSFTEGTTGAGIQLSTALAGRVTSGHDYSASLDITQTDCWASDPADLDISIINPGGTGGPVFRGPINTCALPVHVIGGESVGTFFGRASVRATGPAIEVSVNNLAGSGGGNDSAFDNLAVVDVTPSLAQSFGTGPANGAWPTAAAAPLTLTVINTAAPGFPDLPSGPKLAWGFTDVLPAGLIVASPFSYSTTCARGTLTVSAGVLTGSGDLGPADVACQFTVGVTSNQAGSYTNSSASFTPNGLLDPNSASVAFVDVPHLAPTGSAPPGGAAIAAAVATVLGASLIVRTGRSRRRGAGDRLR